MKHLLTIKNWQRGPGGKKIYEDEDGKKFIGIPMDYVAIGDKVHVELSEGPLKDGYWHVIQFIKHYPQHKQKPT